MTFLKYLLFLVLMIVTGVLLYFGTQDGKFHVSEFRVIDAPAEVIFNFTNDYKNWENFGSWMEDETLKINYPEITSGVGASYSWSSEKDGKGAMQTLAVEPYEKIVQKIVFNGSLEDDGYEIVWSFEPEEFGKKTKVTWSIKGELGLFEKIFFTVYGMDMNAMLSEMYVESLSNLETAIARKMESYSIDIEGLSIHPGWFFISNSILTPLPEKEETMDLLQKRIYLFFSENNLQVAGPHFALQQTFTNELSVMVTVGIPSNDFVALPEISDYASGYLEESAAVKAILKGNYTHLDEALEAMEAYIDKNNYIKKNSRFALIVFEVSKYQDVNPANWVTNIYIPIENSVENPE